MARQMQATSVTLAHALAGMQWRSGQFRENRKTYGPLP
jgi:hypothetical protein